MQKKVIVGIVLIVGLAVIFAITKPKEAPSRLTPITFAVANGAVTELLSFVVKHEELDKDNGLDVTFIYDNPGDLERRYLNNEFPGVFTTSPLFAAETTLAGRPITVLGPSINITYYLAVRADSSAQNIDDLIGRKIGVLPKVTAAYKSMALILNSAGIDPESDFSLTFGPIPEMINLLVKGEVDAAIVAYPGAAALFSSGEFRSVAKLETLWEENEGGFKHPFVSLMAFNEWYTQEGNRELAEQVIAMYFDAVALMRRKPEVITDENNPLLKEYLERTNLTDEGSKQLLRENVATFFPDGPPNAQGVREIELMFTRAQQADFLPKDPLIDTIVLER